MEKGTQLIWSNDTFRNANYSIGSIEEAFGGYVFLDSILEIDFGSEIPQEPNAFMRMIEMTMLLAQKLSVQNSEDITVNFNPTEEENLSGFSEQFVNYGFEYKPESDTWSKVVTCEVVEQE